MKDRTQQIPPKIPSQDKMVARNDMSVLILIFSLISIVLFVFSDISFLLMIASILFAISSLIVAFKNFIINKVMIIATMFSVVACTLGVINVVESIAIGIQDILYSPYEPYYSQEWDIIENGENNGISEPSYWD